MNSGDWFYIGIVVAWIAFIGIRNPSDALVAVGGILLVGVIIVIMALLNRRHPN